MLDLKTGTVKKESQQSSARMTMGARRSFICRMRLDFIDQSGWFILLPDMYFATLDAQIFSLVVFLQVWNMSSGTNVHEQAELSQE